jgi:hypothetical protein
MEDHNSGGPTANFGDMEGVLKDLQNHGVTHEQLARLQQDGAYAKRVAWFMRGSIDHTLARAIMEKNFFGAEDWAALYGVNFSETQYREIAEFPWSADVLYAPCPFYQDKRVKDTHFAFLGLDCVNGVPLTIRKWHDLHPEDGQPRFYFAPEPWYQDWEFASKNTCDFRWYLLLQEIVPSPVGICTSELSDMLIDAGYLPPSPIEEVTKNMLCYRKNGTYLNQSWFGRSAQIEAAEFAGVQGHVIAEVTIGPFRKTGLFIGLSPLAEPDSASGVAASRFPHC